MLVLFVVHHFVIDPICMWHEFLLKQLLYVHYVENSKKDCSRLVHSLMHGLVDTIPLVG
jgi:hypothetical protein